MQNIVLIDLGTQML